MQLLPCHRPTGPLESAPRSSLRADSEHGRWEGFWSLADERYYTRCTRGDGTEQWYRIEDNRGAPTLRYAMYVSERRNGHAMLVGVSRRRTRPEGSR